MKARYLISFFVYFVFFVANSGLHAAEKTDHAAALTPFLNNDTFAACYLNIASLPAGNTAEILPLLPALPEEAQSQLIGLMVVDGLVKKLQGAGIQGVYLVAGLGDLHEEGGPVVIATTAPEKRPEDAERMFKDLIQELRNPKQFNNQRLAQLLDVRRRENLVLFGTRASVNRYASLAPGERNDFIEPVTRHTSEGAVLAGAFAPGPDFRRVVRELWPKLPDPLAPLKGELADRWRTLEFAANAPPNANPRLILQTYDPQAAQTFVDLYHALPAAADQFAELGEQRQEMKGYLETFIGLVPARVENTRVTLSLSPEKPQLENLQAVFTKLSDKAMESSRRSVRMNRFKQLLIAMHVYHDKNKQLPPAAVCDKDGRPLLSWRVAILPYMDREEAELYKQFHLDEPWDSPHNRSLIEKMPDLFADPDPKVRKIAGPGATTFQVPTGPGTAFSNNAGTTFKQISDGTAKTILVVEVEPLKAVPWTKPADWQVDLEHPRSGIERTDRNVFAAGFADAHTNTFRTDIDEATLRAMLTRAGGESFNWP